MHELQPNTTLQNGKYKILKTLGQGGFGITYLAEMSIVGNLKKSVKQVAIKEFFMQDDNVREGTILANTNSTNFIYYRKKFRREAENLAKMNHNNIVNVIDLFDENGTTYYSMDYIFGSDLESYINANGGLSENESIQIISEVSKGLTYMHANGMLHLDLKPQNIMRGDDGRIVIIDFGLAKRIDENGIPESSSKIGGLTPGYAPIEQTIFDGVFAPTLDIYALGATFYKMLTGVIRPPVASEINENGFSSLKKALSSKGISKGTIAVIEKAMQSKKKDRYQSVNEFIQALPKINESDTIIDTHPLSPEDLNDLGKEHYKNKNYQEAFNYFSQAAKMDFPNAEYNLGVCYEKGKGVDQSFLYAAIYYKNAADKNFPNAKEKYEEIIKKHPEYKQSNIRTTFIIILMIGIAVLFGYVLLKLFGNFFSDNPKSATETIQAAPMQKPATESILAAEYQDVKVNETFQKLLGKWGAGKDNAGYSVEFCEGGKCKFIKKGQNIQFKSWRLKDEQTIEFEAETNSKSFFMPWQIINITANQLVVKNGETEISLNRLDSNYE